MLVEHDIPFTIYPYDTIYLLYTETSDVNKEAIQSFSWAEDARKDEVKFQRSLAFPIIRGIAGDNSVLGLTRNARGGRLSTVAQLLRSVKPTMSHSFLSAGQRIIS